MMKIGSRDGVILVAAYYLVTSLVGVLVNMDPGKSFSRSRPSEYFRYANSLKAIENVMGVVVDAIVIIGVWNMDEEQTRTCHMKESAPFLKNPRRALLIFIAWHISASPASLGTDMIFNYYAADSRLLIVVSATTRILLEIVKYYIVYQFWKLYRNLEDREKPIQVEMSQEARLSPAIKAANTTEEMGQRSAAVFKRRHSAAGSARHGSAPSNISSSHTYSSFLQHSVPHHSYQMHSNRGSPSVRSSVLSSSKSERLPTGRRDTVLFDESPSSSAGVKHVNPAAHASAT